MSFQDEVNRSEKKTTDFPHEFYKIASLHLQTEEQIIWGLYCLNENIAWLCTRGQRNGCPNNGNRKDGESQTTVSALNRPSKSLPASVSSSTFSLCASSVTVQLRGPFAWDWCQAAEVALTRLPYVQKSWNNSLLHVGRWTWKGSDPSQFEPQLSEFRCWDLSHQRGESDHVLTVRFKP